jgi:hypothetical protein
MHWRLRGSVIPIAVIPLLYRSTVMAGLVQAVPML